MRLWGERNWAARPKRVLPPYTQWEDYKLGMFGNSIDIEKRDLYIALLKNPTSLHIWMSTGVQTCPVRWSMVISTRMNHQAWLGAIAGCLYCGCNDTTTRNAWGFLLQGEQAVANAVADKVKEEAVCA